MSLARLAACLCAAALPGCLVTTPPGAFFSSTPSGARVMIDGHDSGFVTPCQLDVDTDDEVRVDLELEGYQPASMVLATHSSTTVIGWSHGNGYPIGSLTIPPRLGARDLFLPYRPDHGHHPHRVHVRLLPVGE